MHTNVVLKVKAALLRKLQHVIQQGIIWYHWLSSLALTTGFFLDLPSRFVDLLDKLGAVGNRPVTRKQNLRRHVKSIAFVIPSAHMFSVEVHFKEAGGLRSCDLIQDTVNAIDF